MNDKILRVGISTWLQKKTMQHKDCSRGLIKVQNYLKNCKSKYKSIVWRGLLPLIFPLSYHGRGGVFLLRMRKGRGGEGRLGGSFSLFCSTVPVVVKPGGITRDYDMMCLFCQVFIMRFTVWHDEWFFEQSIFSLAGWRRGWCWLLCTVLWLVLWAR